MSKKKKSKRYNTEPVDFYVVDEGKVRASKPTDLPEEDDDDGVASQHVIDTLGFDPYEIDKEFGPLTDDDSSDDE